MHEFERGVTKYDIMPIPPIEAQSQRFEIGPVSIWVEYRLLDEAIGSRGYQRLFSAKRLKDYRESFKELSGNREVCQTTICMYQSLFLTERKDMDQIIAAVRKIKAHGGALAKAV